MRYILPLVVSFAMQCFTLQADAPAGFQLVEDVAQYKGSDYSNVIHVERGISLEQAFEIAESIPEVDYFVYTKGYCMVLEVPPEVQLDPSNDPFGLLSFVHFIYDSGDLGLGYCRIFHHGDTVFFKKDGVWLGSANGLA